MKVQLYIPCFIDQFYPSTGISSYKLLTAAGCTVLYHTEQTCCGQPAFNSGFVEAAKPVCAKFVQELLGAPYTVIPSASCTAFVRNDLPKVASLEASSIYELTEFLVNICDKTQFGAKLYGRAVYHDSCSALHGCKIYDAPRKLLAGVQGLELLELPDQQGNCCGFGGMFSVQYEAISVSLAQQKVESALRAEATYIISADTSCLMHLEGYIQKNSLPLRAIHIADVLTSGW